MKKWEGILKGMENDLRQVDRLLNSVDVSLSKIEAIRDGKGVWAFHTLTELLPNPYEPAQFRGLKVTAKGYIFGNVVDGAWEAGSRMIQTV